ncbi:hypothetical protein DBR42_13895 [Pelomonas sp. HMWF004]|nr:hypothetical protein DBR42_13895 [Pelomonas sp. HMWF004]
MNARTSAAARGAALGEVPGANPTRAQVEGGLIWAQSEGQVAHFWVYIVCGLLAWLGLPLLFAAWRMFRTSRHRYELTDQRLSEQRGVFLRDTEQLELFRVRDISVVEPIVQRLFGCGRVVLLTTDRTTPVVVLNAVSEPHGVADLIRASVQACRMANGVREVQE